jgi:hypothetical protein
MDTASFSGVTATFLGTLLVFLLAAGALALGQWFGRAPITGRCRPRAGFGCGREPCCRNGREPPGRPEA